MHYNGISVVPPLDVRTVGVFSVQNKLVFARETLSISEIVFMRKLLRMPILFRCSV